MFEPQKLITVALAAVLLAPFGYVFWSIAAHRPRPETQVRAELEAAPREQGGQQITPEPDGGVTISRVVAVRQVEAIGFFESTNSWLAFFPRSWVGLLGLLGMACIFACLIVSLFFPGGTEMSASELPEGGKLSAQPAKY
jgi:hypothetical protein